MPNGNAVMCGAKVCRIGAGLATMRFLSTLFFPRGIHCLCRFPFPGTRPRALCSESGILYNPEWAPQLLAPD